MTKKEFSSKQVGNRIRERRIELQLSMPELAKRLGVNKSTIQRYEYDGVDPKRTMIINSLADVLLTTPEWLTGISDDKEYSSYTECKIDLSKHINTYLDFVTTHVNNEAHQLMLTDFLGKIIDLFSFYCYYFAEARTEIENAMKDTILTESLIKYKLNNAVIEANIYHDKVDKSINNLISFIDGLSHFYDVGRTKVDIPELFKIVTTAESEIKDKLNSSDN